MSSQNDYRQKAADALAQARAASDESTKSELYEMAIRYMRLAEHVEAGQDDDE